MITTYVVILESVANSLIPGGHQRATAQPRAFLDKYKQWEASGNRKIASHGLLVLKHIFYELVALKL